MIPEHEKPMFPAEGRGLRITPFLSGPVAVVAVVMRVGQKECRPAPDAGNGPVTVSGQEGEGLFWPEAFFRLFLLNR